MSSGIGADYEARLLDHVVRHIRRFVAFPNDIYAYVVALWILHTYLIQCFENTGRLAGLSPEPASGKSRLAEIVEDLSCNAIQTINATESAIFRTVESMGGRVTLIFDEVDTIYAKVNENPGLTGLINSGYRHGASVLRSEGDSHEVKRFSTFAPVFLSGLDKGLLPEALLTRTIVIPMKRRAPGQTVEPYRRRVLKMDIRTVREELGLIAERIEDQVTDRFPQLPEGIEDRAADIWEPLITIADAVGGHWPQTAREVAVEVVTASKGAKPSIGIQLLTDIHAVFEEWGSDDIKTEELRNRLCEMEESPWAEWYGREITARFIRDRLAGYEIGPQQFRSPVYGGEIIRGYRRHDFQDAFTRYLAPSPETSGTNGTPGTTPESRGSFVPDAELEAVHEVVQANGHTSASVPDASGTETRSGTKQARNHADVPLVPAVPLAAEQCRTTDLETARRLLAEHPGMDINKLNRLTGWGDLQRAGRALDQLRKESQNR